MTLVPFDLRLDPRPPGALDHFAVRDGVLCAGTHLILDFFETDRLDDLELMESAMRTAVEVAGATLIDISLHHFTPFGGISGVAILAESHLSVHTWPEQRYAAFDVFMCGDARPEAAADALAGIFRPARVVPTRHLRGILP